MATTLEPSPTLLHSPVASPMDSGPHHHPSTYHHEYPFLPAAGDGVGAGQPRNPAVGESTDTLLLFLAVPAGSVIRLAAFLGEHVASAILSLVVLPVAALVGELRAAPAAAAALVRRAASGLLAAAFTFAVMVAALVVSLLLGFVLVRHWVEDPVTVRQPLYFDYTEPQPSAAVALGGAALPAGHSVRVSMALLLPDSDHNREIGVFQIKAEAITPSGNTIASATQPYMLRYKSAPVRLAQSALLCVPLAIGIRSESQAATLKLLQYKEGHGRHRRTGLIRVFLQPRAMTVQLPQLYKAEVVVQTSLPWTKCLARSLKWTLCVWISSSVYVVLTVLAICWVRPFALSAALDRRSSDHQVNGKSIADLVGRDLSQRPQKDLSGGAGVKWKERRSKSKAQCGGRLELKIAEGSRSRDAVMEADEVTDDPWEPICARSSVSEFS